MALHPQQPTGQLDLTADEGSGQHKPRALINQSHQTLHWASLPQIARHILHIGRAGRFFVKLRERDMSQTRFEKGCPLSRRQRSSAFKGGSFLRRSD